MIYLFVLAAPSSLVILQWNCRSIRDKKDELQSLIKTHNPHVIALCETWLMEKHNIFINGYTIARKDRFDGYGGVLIACRNDLVVTTLTINTTFECIGCSIDLSSGNKIAIASLYLPSPPGTQPTGPDLEALVTQIPEPCFILGDFNAHGQQWGGQFDDRRAQILSKVFDDNDLVTLNTGEPTRIACPPIASSALDISVCSSQLGLSCTWQVTDDPHGSDHLPIIVGYNILNDAPLPSSRSTPNLTKNILWDIYKECIDQATFFDDDVEMHHYEKMVNHIKESAAQAQSKPITQFVAPLKHLPKAWWTSELNDLYHQKKEAFRAFKRIGGRAEYLDFKRQEAVFKRLKKQLKTEKWREYCSTLNKDTPLSDMFSMAKRFRGCYSNRTIRSDEWVPDFVSKLAPPTTQVRNHIFTDTNHSDLFDGPFSSEEMENALHNSNNSCPGLDLVTFALIKQLPTSGKAFLLKMFNYFMDTENIPDAWYDCKVITILKPGKDPLLATSYRPICLLSCLRKVFEKMLHNRLDYWVESNHLGSLTQFGFRKGFGTTDCLAILSTDLQTCFAQKSMCLAVFMDITSAYDDVQIEILCNILEELQLPRIAVKLIDLLFHKRHLVIYNNNILIDRRIGYKGLAQGSTLSPLLFNLYTIRIDHNIISPVKILQYADDVVIYSSGLSKNRLQNNLQTTINNLYRKYRDLGLDISTSKTEFVVFTKKYKVPIFRLNINTTPLKCVKTFKYLGVVFDDKCLWKEHVTYVTKKCVKRVNFLRTVSGSWWGAHPSSLLIVYKSTIRSVLEYGAFAIQSLANTHKLRLERVQWRALRVCLGMMTSTHTRTLEVQAGILPLDLRWKELNAKFLCKSLAGPSQLLQQSIVACLSAKPDHQMAELFHVVSELDIQPSIKFPCYQTRWPCLMFTPKISKSIQNFIQASTNSTSRDVRRAYSDAVNALGPAKFIFTDGSKSELGTGSALWSDSNQVSISMRLQEPATVFTAELSAIQMATTHITSQPSGKFVIVTDSLSSMDAITMFTISAKTPIIILEIVSNLYDLQIAGYDITLLWTPAHVGIPGNERADTLAKEAATTGNISLLPPLWHDQIPKLRAHTIQEWQERWRNGDLGRYYFSIQPKVKKRPWYEAFETDLERWHIRIANRLASNHYCLNHHLNRVNIVESPICQRCDAYENADHVLFHCPGLIHRDRLELQLNAIGATRPYEIRNILATCRSAATIRTICEFLDNNDIKI